MDRLNILSRACILLILFTFHETKEYNSTHPLVLLEAVYWEVKPFMFTNEKGEIDGIIPQMFRQAQYYCLRNNDSIQIMRYTRKIETRREFYDLVRSNQSYGEGQLEGVLRSKAFWAPVVSYTNRQKDSFEQDRNLKTFQLMKSKEVAVIVQRAFISLPNKILRGILSCQEIFVLAILLAVLFGMILWILERHRNEDFPHNFMQGAGAGLYWSLVSMTTVGYGDITPRSIPGRFIGCFWLFVGVMIGCVMTATMTGVVTGVDDFSVFDKTVSVLEQSFEQKIAAKDYRARVVTAKSYEDVLDLVRRGEVFAAMMNADVAAWYQTEISDDNNPVPLRIVQKLPANLYVNCLVAADVSKTMKNIFKCMYFQRDEVYTYATEEFQRYCHTEHLHIGSTKDLFKDNMYIQILLGILCGLFLIGITYDVFRYMKKNSTMTKDNEKAYRSVLVPADNNRHLRSDESTVSMFPLQRSSMRKP